MEKKTRILVVEDNPDDQELLIRMLKKARLAEQVEITADGMQALEYLSSHELETEQLVAVFLDLNLPSITGIELLKWIRLSDKLTHLPVVVMTSSNSSQDLEACRQLGVSCYVQKPLTVASFTSAIANIFHQAGGTGGMPRTFRSE